MVDCPSGLWTFEGNLGLSHLCFRVLAPQLMRARRAAAVWGWAGGVIEGDSRWPLHPGGLPSSVIRAPGSLRVLSAGASAASSCSPPPSSFTRGCRQLSAGAAVPGHLVLAVSWTAQRGKGRRVTRSREWATPPRIRSPPHLHPSRKASVWAPRLAICIGPCVLPASERWGQVASWDVGTRACCMTWAQAWPSCSPALSPPAGVWCVSLRPSSLGAVPFPPAQPTEP